MGGWDDSMMAGISDGWTPCVWSNAMSSKMLLEIMARIRRMLFISLL